MPRKKAAAVAMAVPSPECYALPVETCLFCSALVKEGERRFEERSSVQDFVTSHFHPSPFVYKRIADNRLREFESLCLSCSCLMRRSEKKGPRDVSKRTGLPIDRFLTYLVNPGEVMMLDCRCLLRIRESLKAATLGLAWTDLPVMANALVEAVRKRLLEGDEREMQVLMVLSWWEYNGHPHYFSSPLTARAVRRCMKQTGGVDFHVEQTGLEGIIEASSNVHPPLPPPVEAAAIGLVDGGNSRDSDGSTELDALLTAAIQAALESDVESEMAEEAESDWDAESAGAGAASKRSRRE